MTSVRIREFGRSGCAVCGIEFTKSGPRSRYCSSDCKNKYLTRQCAACQANFGTKDPNAQFCSQVCYGSTLMGRPASDRRKRVGNGGVGWHPNAPQVLIDSTQTQPVSWLLSDGYVRYYWKSHPKSTGTILEHRAVGYALWGDVIDGMHVDHKNTDRSDNRPENLQLFTKSQHMKKTALKDSDRAFGRWVKEEHPELFEEWRLLKVGVGPLPSPTRLLI